MTIIVENCKNIIISQLSQYIVSFFFVIIIVTDLVGLYMTESNKVCYYNTGNDVLALVVCAYAMYFSPRGLP
jgi:hypothetical protein